MTVKELVENLQDLPQDKQVMLSNNYGHPVELECINIIFEDGSILLS